jgi:primosomal replication protein N''
MEIREQGERLKVDAAARAEGLEAKRLAQAKRIQSIEAELDAHHRSLHAIDPSTELSYRALLAELITLRDAGAFAEAPALRETLGGLDPVTVAEIQEIVAPLAVDWLASQYEGSPLAVTKVFNADAAVAREFRHRFVDFVKAEAERKKALGECADAFELSEAEAHERWLTAHDSTLTGIDEQTRHHLALWYEHFQTWEGRASVGAESITALETVVAGGRALDGATVSAQLAEAQVAKELAALPESECRMWHARFRDVLEGSSLWARVHPRRVSSRLKIRRFLKDLNLQSGRANLQFMERLLALDLGVRPLRASAVETFKQFAGHPLSPDWVTAQGVSVAASARVSARGRIGTCGESRRSRSLP